ncbi:hypothetical protein H5410_035693 [Solanum commersonii]|uniref:Uncharacterized protein n=1 Tax=Solanum commersonii TaxID=4109 RepID=A0A9J5Y2L4_SOLCO|nr:hypothetical protein H5410_035693 [Solanum commersonii]
MNAHNKTQLTHTRINCALKDSSCDLPLSKMFRFTILASNASSVSTKVLKCPHNNDDSIFTHNFSTIYSSRIIYDSHTHKNEHMHDFIHMFSLIFQLIFVPTHSRSKRGVTIIQVSSKKRIKLKGVQVRFIHLTRLSTKRGILSNCFTNKNRSLRSFQEFALLSQPDQRVKFEVSPHTMFKVSSSHKALAPRSNETHSS